MDTPEAARWTTSNLSDDDANEIYGTVEFEESAMNRAIIDIATQARLSTFNDATPGTNVSGNYRFVQVNEFQPNVDGWNQFGNVTRILRDGSNALVLYNAAGYAVRLSMLSPSALRVQFRPEIDPTYLADGPSYAVTNRDLGDGTISVQKIDKGGPTLQITTSELVIYVGLEPYGIAIYRDGRLVTQDTYGKNLIFSNEAVACLRESPLSESYYGFGEKAGTSLDKKYFTMTCFNYDNFCYEGANVVPVGNEPGPLNPSEPLYNSIPFCLAVGRSDGTPSSQDHAYGVYLDNVSQTYFNMGSNDYSDMSGKYYFGALYGDLDYYILVGTGSDLTSDIRAVLDAYSALTGRSAMPPKYAFGYQQGCYGYYSRDILMSVAQAYRDAQIPIDGLHIDVDFQNNYRTFTSSPEKFPDPKGMFDTLHGMGFKCSTNITGIISANPLDERGSRDTPYPTRDAFVTITSDNRIQVKPGVQPPFLYDTRADQGESPDLFIANEAYGDDDTSLYPNGFNPFKYPTPLFPDGQESLGTYGFYADMGNPKVQRWWGEQYQYLLEIGIDMIWQDMTCPAVVPNEDNDTPDKTLPLDLMMYDPVTSSYQPNAKVHNAFALNLVRATYQGLTALRASSALAGTYNAGKRNFIIARGGFAGIQRYAGIWTGDSASSWDFLAINIPEVLNIGLSGLPISGCDIGGFATGSGSMGQGITDYVLFTRWMNLGAFLPWYRNHYDGYQKLFQEPYRYGDPVPAQCRSCIETRYRLLQLFYDAMFENTQSGLPICRALFVNDAHDPAVDAHLNDEFFIGDDLLVAPVVTANQYARDVYLPAGSQWYVFSDISAPLGDPTPGGTTQNWYVPLGLVPLYVREGAIIPLRELEQYVGQRPRNPLTFTIYPGRDSTYTLYQDDGTTTANVDQRAYRVTRILHRGIPGGQQVQVERTYDRYTPPESHYYVAFLGTNAPASVTRGSTTLPNAGSVDALRNSASDAYAYDPTTLTTFIKVDDDASKTTLTALWSQA